MTASPTSLTHPPAIGTLEQQVDIETPEQVVLSYTVAGIGSHAAAALLDYLILFLASTGLIVLLMILSRVASVGVPSTAVERGSGAWALAVLFLLLFAVQWGYFVFFEALWDGQTPGKRRLGLRVVQDGGYSVSFGASAVRNIARILDMQPGFLYAVGIVSAAFNKSGKRLGDTMAGTFVVQERVVRTVPEAAAAEAATGTAPVAASLSDAEYELLEGFLARRASLTAERRAELTEQLVERFRQRVPEAEAKPAAALRQLYERERAARASGVAARGATGAAREQHSIVARGAGRWSAFAAALREAQRTGLRHMTEQQVSDFVARYRVLATDLARLKTASHGRDSDALFYLSRLVAAGHNLLYRQRPLTGQAIGRFLFADVPREVRRSALPILGAAACLFLPTAATYAIVVRHPAVAESLLPSAMIDRANEGVARARRGERTYVRIRDFERPVMASQIIGNNVQVTYAVFAFGITAGIFTVLMLVYNGVSFGAALGLYASKGILSQIGEFVLAHSVFELSAICIAGGGGLLIASALLLPGRLTRREAIVVKGRRAIRLIALSTMLLIVAGTIEGLISPRTDIPIGVKVAVAALCAAALAAYVGLGGRGAAEGAPAEDFGYSEARALISR